MVSLQLNVVYHPAIIIVYNYIAMYTHMQVVVQVKSKHHRYY